MSSYTQYRENPPAITHSFLYLNREDTECVFAAYIRVGMAEFTHSDVADLLDRAMMRKLKILGILRKTPKKSKTYTGVWRFKSEMAYRIRQTLGS